MSYTQAIASAGLLAACLERRGVAVSVEIQTGVAGSGWYDGRKVAEMSHHTVSRRSMGATPVLGLVKRGRPDVPGPLANGYGGFDEVYRIITMAWANHAGVGGPLTVAGYHIPRNNGRPYIWATEYEGGLDPADFTLSYRRFMARSNAGILEWLDQPVEAHIEHSTWSPGRKVDRLGYSAVSGRAEIIGLGEPPAAETAAPTSPTFSEETDMRGVIEAFYRTYLHRDGSTGEIDYRVVRAVRESRSLETERRDIARSAEARIKAVQTGYVDLLGRKANQKEINYWTSAANERNLDYEAIRADIANSAEGRAFAALPEADRAKKIAEARS